MRHDSFIFHQRIIISWVFFLTHLVSLNLLAKNLDKSLTNSNNPFLCEQNTYPVEKVYIHFDKPSYFISDQIWFKVYVLDGQTNMPDTRSKIVYVELIDPFNKIVNSRMIHTKQGGGEGAFELTGELNIGLYTVRAYTNYMRNFDDSFFFTKEIYINSYHELKRQNAVEANGSVVSIDEMTVQVENKPDLQFFPEGGYFVEGLPARVGFKAMTQKGKGLNVKGILLDQTGKELVNFSTLHLGMGSVQFVPEPGNSISAKVTHLEKNYFYELPKPLKEGVIMQVVNRGDFYQINLQSSLKQGVDGLSLIGLQRGLQVCVAELKGSESKGVIKVPLTTLDNGILKLTIYSKKKQPLCERLVFVELDKSVPSASIKTNKKTYSTRELVDVELSLENISKTTANVSIAVTDISALSTDDCGFDIRSYLLLNSEIKGEIEDPCFYFDSDDAQRKKYLDLLMMTQGWRKYLWDAIKMSEDDDLLYSFESGIDFKGSVRSIFNHDVPVNTNVSLTYSNSKIFGHDESKTFGEGQFLFPGYLFTDSTSILIQAKKKKVRKKGSKQGGSELNRDFYIQMDSVNSPEITFEQGQLREQPAMQQNLFETSIEADSLSALYANQPEYITLNDVEVKISKKPMDQKYIRNNMRYQSPRFRVDYVKENAVALGDDLFRILENRVPALSRNYITGEYYYRGSKVDFFLDGVRFPNAASLNSLINANDVSFIDLLSGPQAVTYFSQAAIIVYSKSGSDRKNKSNSGPKKGIVSFNYPGLYKAKEFYAPKYPIQESNQQKPDFRVTLHWVPSLILNDLRKTSFSFYTADPSATYRIEVQGVSREGHPFTNEAYFSVED